MLKIRLTLLLAITSTFLTAQTPGFDYAFGFLGYNGSSYMNTICSDSSGNMYFAGSFLGTVDFVPGPDTAFVHNPGYGWFTFILKLDNNGNFKWVRTFESTGGIGISSISTDNSGAVYSTGTFTSDTVDFDPSLGGTHYLHGSNLYPDNFICKLDSSGNFVWAKKFGGSQEDHAYALALDSTGNVYVTGDFRGYSNFDYGNTNYLLYAAGFADAFLLKYDPAGNFMWVKQLASPVAAKGNALTTYENSIFVGGDFKDTIDVDPGPGINQLVVPLAGSSLYNGFIARFDLNGNLVWGQSHPHNGNGTVSGIAHDDFGNIYSTGNFSASCDFDGGPGTFTLSPGSNGQQIFLLKTDTSGAFNWVKQLGGFGTDYGIDIDTDPAGNVYSTGRFLNTSDFDPGPGVFTLSSGAGFEVYISQLDSTGNFMWAGEVGGSDDDAATSIFVRPDFDIYFGGIFKAGTTDFDPGPGVFPLLGNVQTGFFVKLNKAVIPGDTISVTVCDTFLSPSGNYIWDTTGVYTDTIVTTLYYDSLVTVFLDVIPDVISVTAMGAVTFCAGDSVVLSATPGLSNYQWYRRNYAIPGATSENYTAEARGRYRCIALNSLSCMDTSNTIIVSVPCVPVDPAQNRQIPDSDAKNEFTVSPNPSAGMVTVRSGTGELQIINTLGKAVLINEVNENEEAVFDLSEFPSGMYLFLLRKENSFYSKKIIIY